MSLANLKSILVSCGARLAPFDIEEVRDITMYDELSLDTVGDKKTALFLIMSDTDPTFNFLISMIYTQLFNLLCEKADDVYGGRLPVHVRCLIDECANIGQIPNLEKLVATIDQEKSRVSGASGTEPVEGNLQGQRRYHHRQYGFPYFSWRFGADYAERAESGTGERND